MLTHQGTQRAADTIAAVVLPANIAIWLADIDLLLRICVSVGSLILIGFALAAKWGKWRQS